MSCRNDTLVSVEALLRCNSYNSKGFCLRFWFPCLPWFGARKTFPFFMESGFLAPEREQKAGTHTTP